MSLSSLSSPKKRNKLEGLRIRNEIRRLNIEGKQSREICKILDISYDNFKYYCSKIYREDKHILETERRDTLAHEVLQAKERLEGIILRMNTILDDTNTSVKDRVDAARLLIETSLNTLRLTVEGPKLLSNVGSDDNTASLEDNFPSDEFVKFAEASAREQFQRSFDIKTGETNV